MMWDGVYSSMEQKDIRIVSDPKKVFISHSKKNGKSKYETCLITAFSNKAYCLDKYLAGIDRLKKSQMCSIVYDNSNSKKFGERLFVEFKKRFNQVLFLRDENQHFNIEHGSHYNLIDDRIWFIYSTAFKYVGSCDYVLIIEDDVEVPKLTYEKMKACLDNYMDLGTVVGCQNERRRVFDKSYGRPVVWNVVREFDFSIKKNQYTIRSVEDKKFGVEKIGSAHTGCWMTRSSLIRKFVSEKKRKPFRYFDQSWGVNLRRMGYDFAIDWSIQCKHYNKVNGKLVYV